MKKTLSLILSAVLILSTLITLIIPASAEGEGDWDVMLAANAKDATNASKIPLTPGYYYDETGFHTISPDYTNRNPKFTVISKEMYDLDNFSMTVVIHDYCTMGDNWLSFSVWSESNGLAQGDTSGKYGDGWTSLIRPDLATGTLNRLESWNATKGGRTGKQVFTPIDETQLSPIVFDEIINEDGDRVITFAIEDGVVKVNGKAISPGTDNCIASRFTEGLAYIGVTLHNTDNSGKYSPTISITDVNGEVPTGTDYRKPEPTSEGYKPPLMRPDEVPYGQPAIWFDATMENSNYTMPAHTGCDLTYADDNKSFLVKPESDSLQIRFDVRDEILYDASDFPYFAIIFKNFCTCDIPEGKTPFEYCSRYEEQTTVWYYAGEHTAPNTEGVMQISEYICLNPRNHDGYSTVDDFYTVAVFEISDLGYWKNRIHGFRLDIDGLTNYAKEGRDTMEILGAGFFRSGMEIVSYIGNMNVDNNNRFDIAELKSVFDPYYIGCTECFDKDGNGLCDICWEDIRDISWDCEKYGHAGDEDKDGYCDLCWESLLPVSDETTALPVETDDETEEDQTKEKTTKDDIYDDSDAPVITIAGCELSASLGIVSIVAIIGAGIVIKKKED